MLWFFPVLMLLWVNTHGSWIIGMGAVLVYWISGFFEFQLGNLEAQALDPERALPNLGNISAVAPDRFPSRLMEPAVAASPFEFAFSLPLNVANIEEWQSMPFHEVIGKAFLALLLLIVAQVTLNLRWRVEELLLFLFGTAMACLHLRFLLVFVPFAIRS